MPDILAAILLGIVSVISAAVYVGKKSGRSPNDPVDNAYAHRNYKDPDDGSFERAHPSKEDYLKQLRNTRHRPDEDKQPFPDRVIASLENMAHGVNQNIEDIMMYFRVRAHEAVKNNGKRR